MASMLVVRLAMKPLRDYELVFASQAWGESQQVRELERPWPKAAWRHPFENSILAKGMLDQTYGDKQRASMFEPQFVVNLLRD